MSGDGRLVMASCLLSTCVVLTCAWTANGTPLQQQTTLLQVPPAQPSPVLDGMKLVPMQAMGQVPNGLDLGGDPVDPAWGQTISPNLEHAWEQIKAREEDLGIAHEKLLTAEADLAERERAFQAEVEETGVRNEEQAELLIASAKELAAYAKQLKVRAAELEREKAAIASESKVRAAEVEREKAGIAYESKSAQEPKSEPSKSDHGAIFPPGPLPTDGVNMFINVKHHSSSPVNMNINIDDSSIEKDEEDDEAKAGLDPSEMRAGENILRQLYESYWPEARVRVPTRTRIARMKHAAHRAAMHPQSKAEEKHVLHSVEKDMVKDAGAATNKPQGKTAKLSKAPAAKAAAETPKVVAKTVQKAATLKHKAAALADHKKRAAAAAPGSHLVHAGKMLNQAQAHPEGTLDFNFMGLGMKLKANVTWQPGAAAWYAYLPEKDDDLGAAARGGGWASLALATSLALLVPLLTRARW